MQYIIYMDESGKEGRFFGNFYGGALVRSKDYNYVVTSLTKKKEKLGLNNEIKWQNVTTNYLDKYIQLMDLFFEFIEHDIIKMRVMFTQNYRRAKNLSKEQEKSEFLLLYYQFFKHAFGLKYSNYNTDREVALRLYFDQLPVAPSDEEMFKSYVQRLVQQEFSLDANLSLNNEDITGVNSKEHVILQYMDVVLGSMYFRLNDLHKEKPIGKRTRGKRTIAKEKLYKHIIHHIRRIYPNFNIGMSTGHQNDRTNRWKHPYRHWLFVANEHEIADEYRKRK